MWTTNPWSGSGVVIACALVLALGCGRSEVGGRAPAPGDPEGALASLRTKLEAVHAQRDAAAFARLHTESAIFEWQGRATPLVGRTELEESRLKVWAARRDLRLTNSVSELTVHGDRAYEFGSYEETWTDPKGNHVIERGRYVTSYVRESDGEWRIARLFGFTDSTDTKKTQQ